MTQVARSILVLLLLACAACQSTSIPSITRPSASTTSEAPTPVPPIQIVSYTLVPGSVPGTWRAVGLIENRSKDPIGAIELRIQLVDGSGPQAAVASTSSIMSNLLPGESGPFSVSISSSTAPSGAVLEISAYEVLDALLVGEQRVELVAELDEFFLTGSGELAVLGSITNPGSATVSLSSLSFLGRGPDNNEKLVAIMEFGPTRLGPGETVPILALAPENPGAVRWTPYHDGLISEAAESKALELVGEPQLYQTAQGAPFVVGMLANSGSTAANGSVLVSLSVANRLIGLWEIVTPRPLASGEQLAFTAFGFPGINLRFDPLDPTLVRVETRVEQLADSGAGEAIALMVDVTAFHSVGSALFIRGTVQNPTESEVERATVYAEVRSSLGDLITAGWSESQSLQPGGAAEFVLDLPIPVGLDAALTEYDLRAIGLEAKQ